MTVEEGKTYYGAGGKRQVLRIEDGTVYWLHPIGMDGGETPLAEFEEWAESEFMGYSFPGEL